MKSIVPVQGGSSGRQSLVGGTRIAACSAAAFTLIELLVVVAIIAILAALLLPALTKGKYKAQGICCMSNHRQLTLAWQMYVHENNDKFPYASQQSSPSPLDSNVW